LAPGSIAVAVAIRKSSPAAFGKILVQLDDGCIHTAFEIFGTHSRYSSYMKELSHASLHKSTPLASILTKKTPNIDLVVH
jgi:hypothetical protein